MLPVFTTLVSNPQIKNTVLSINNQVKLIFISIGIIIVFGCLCYSLKKEITFLPGSKQDSHRKKDETENL